MTNPSSSTHLKRPDLETIQAEMEASREAFFALLSAVPVAEWRRKSVATAFTVAELFEHIVHAVELIPNSVAAIRKGKNYLDFPSWLTSKLNLLMTRWAARKATPQSIARRYDVAFDKALQVLNTIQDDE